MTAQTYLFSLSCLLKTFLRISVICCLMFPCLKPAYCFTTSLDSAVQKKDSDLFSIKTRLCARLDSIELEKQARKRQGGSLRDLETESNRIRDSIALLKKQVFTETGYDEKNVPEKKVSPEQKKAPPSLLRSIFNPSGFVDWLIIIMGAAAIISGMILLIGMMQNQVSNKKRKKEEQIDALLSQHPKRKNGAGGIESTAIRPSVSQTPSDKDNINIAALRKRMLGETETRNSSDEDNSSPFSSAGYEEKEETKYDPGELVRDKVLQAAQAGLDAREISRRFHISADQVALILRIAHKTPPKP